MVEAGELRLACRVSGNPAGAPLVLLHALGEDGSDWDAVAGELSAQHRVYAPDLRGHGHSDRPDAYSLELMRDDVIALLDGLELERATLVGHSLGGVVAYLVAQEHPHRVDRLVLEDVPPPYPRDAGLPEPPSGPVQFDWAVVAAVVSQINDPAPEWEARLSEITAPTLLISGGSRSHVPPDQIARMARRIPDSRLVTIPAGHLVHTARPTDFTATLRGFLPARIG